jgi:hypothetical protein
MNLEHIKLSERSQTQEAAYCMIPLHAMLRKSSLTETESDSVIAWGL